MLLGQNMSADAIQNSVFWTGEGWVNWTVYSLAYAAAELLF